MYTSGEHFCLICAAAHGWIGLGRNVYASSAEQTGAWLAEQRLSCAGRFVAQFSQRWGARQPATGKTIWAEQALTSAPNLGALMLAED